MEDLLDRGLAFLPLQALGILIIEKSTKNFDYGSGYVTKWYQSMVATLGLIGLMHESCINRVRSTSMRNNSLT